MRENESENVAEKRMAAYQRWRQRYQLKAFAWPGRWHS
jgi:hypothetical protein